MALRNSILIWGSQHRTHRRFVDDVDKDPYSAMRLLVHAHWIPKP
jgi:stearoyl-CoA desaturase (delta-9 desaturase)